MQKVGGEGRKDAHAEHWDGAKQASNGMRNGETALDARKERACADELRAQRKRAEKEGDKEAGVIPRYAPHGGIRARTTLASANRPNLFHSAALLAGSGTDQRDAHSRGARFRWKRARPAAVCCQRRETSIEGDGLDPGEVEAVGPRRRRSASGFSALTAPL
jgi:hypothetical protein